MPVWISLLRGINVGGNKKIKMAELRELYASLGFVNTQSLLQSGNVVFQSDLTDKTKISGKIEHAIEDTFGFHSDIIVRTHKEWKDFVQTHPFSEEQLAEPKKVAVMFLADVPSPESIEALQEAHLGPEEIQANGHEICLFYPDGMGRSKLTHAFMERKIKTTGTIRNWNTINKILNLAKTIDAS